MLQRLRGKRWSGAPAGRRGKRSTLAATAASRKTSPRRSLVTPPLLLPAPTDYLTHPCVFPRFAAELSALLTETQHLHVTLRLLGGHAADLATAAATVGCGAAVCTPGTNTYCSSLEVEDSDPEPPPPPTATRHERKAYAARAARKRTKEQDARLDHDLARERRRVAALRTLCVSLPEVAPVARVAAARALAAEAEVGASVAVAEAALGAGEAPAAAAETSLSMSASPPLDVRPAAAGEDSATASPLNSTFSDDYIDVVGSTSAADDYIDVVGGAPAPLGRPLSCPVPAPGPQAPAVYVPTTVFGGPHWARAAGQGPTQPLLVRNVD